MDGHHSRIAYSRSGRRMRASAPVRELFRATAAAASRLSLDQPRATTRISCPLLSLASPACRVQNLASFIALSIYGIAGTVYSDTNRAWSQSVSEYMSPQLCVAGRRRAILLGPLRCNPL